MESRKNMRASDADRESAVAHLHAAATEGRLDPDELGERLHAVFNARTYADLDVVTADLPVPVEDGARAGRQLATPGLPERSWGTASGPRAGFWRRFWALAVDNIVCSLVVVILAVTLRQSGLLVGILFYVAYFVYFEGSQSGATPGKRAMGIRIIDARTGDPIGYGRAFLRLFGRVISGAFMDLGYLWMLWDNEKQCWHDKMSNDVVVPTSDYPVQQLTR